MLEDDDPGGRALALFLHPYPGAFRQLMCPHHREFAHFVKKCLCPGVSPMGGGMGTAGIDWRIIFWDWYWYFKEIFVVFLRIELEKGLCSSILPVVVYLYILSHAATFVSKILGLLVWESCFLTGVGSNLLSPLRVYYLKWQIKSHWHFNLWQLI